MTDDEDGEGGEDETGDGPQEPAIGQGPAFEPREQGRAQEQRDTHHPQPAGPGPPLKKRGIMIRISWVESDILML